MAAVGRGGRVAVFCYAGVEKLSDHLDLLAEIGAIKKKQGCDL